MSADGPLRVLAGPPDPTDFAPFGAFLTPPTEVGGRAPFHEWLDGSQRLAPAYHLNRCAATTLPATVARVERHPHVAQLFLPVGVARYLVTVMPSDDAGGPEPAGAKSFIVPGRVGVAYHPGTWHAGIAALDGEGCFAVMMWRGAEDDDVFADIPPLEIVSAGGDAHG